MENQQENEPMTAWLAEYAKSNVRSQNASAFKIYLAWVKKSPRELINEFSQQGTKSQILQFQNYLVNDYVSAHTNQKLSQNSIRSILTSTRAFYSSQCEEVHGLKNKIVDSEMAKGEHVFSLQDLQSMFAIGDLKEKAVLSTALSLGWESSMFLNLDKAFVESLVKRARSQNVEFISFDWQRKKEGTPQFGILNPIALFSLEQYLAKVNKENPNQIKLWDFNEGTLNNILKRLVENANITTVGTIRFHLIRKYVMDSLSDMGFNMYEVHIIVGKSIPKSDLTYLRQLKNNAFEKYKKGYESHFSLTQFVNGKAIYSELADFAVKFVKAQEALTGYMKSKGLLEHVPKAIEDQLNEVYEFAKIMEKKNGDKPKPKEDESHE